MKNLKPWSLYAALIISTALNISFSSRAKAEVIEFPEETLSRESVLPVFDQPEAVKRRFVPMSKRIETGAFLGLTLADPFFDSYTFGLSGMYHFNEFHGVGITGAYVLSQNSKYVAQMRQQVPSSSAIPFETAPAPKYYALAEYEFTPWYGKISITKQRVANLSIAATGAAGTINLGSTSSVAFSLGLNQKVSLPEILDYERIFVPCFINKMMWS